MSPRINSTSISTKSKTTQDKGQEERRWDFRNQEMPAIVFAKLRDEKVTVSDLLFMNVIWGMSTKREDGKGRGCFAQNSYMGRSAGVHPTYVPQRINHLIDIGFILRIEYKGRRYLEIEWFRTAEERASLIGDYGKQLRKAHRDLERRLQLKSKEPLGKHKAPPLGKHKGDLNVSRKSINNCRSQAHDKHIPLFQTTKKGNTPAYKLAVHLHEILLKKNRVYRKVNLRSWAAEFQEMIKRGYATQERISSALDWYAINIGKEYVPEAYSAKTFCSKFGAIESAIQRANGSNPEDVKKRFRDMKMGYRWASPESPEFVAYCHDQNELTPEEQGKDFFNVR